EDHGTTADEIEPRFLAQPGDLPRQPFREADIVGVHPRDELATAERNRLIQPRRKDRSVCFADQPNARIVESRDDSAALVSGAVVYDDQFPGLQSLLLNRAYRS